MENIYPFFIAFILVFLSELGDKTQILVLSFSNKSKTFNILLGIALGTFFSHGLAILFGSKIGNLNNTYFLLALKIVTYITFLLFGVFGFLSKNKNNKSDSTDSKSGILNKILTSSLNYVFIVALSIIVGEIGDKTFLASLGLGLQYPNFKLSLVLGAILGMVVSDSIAIFFGKFIGSKISDGVIDILSNLIFIVFGLIGLIMFGLKYM